VTCYFSILLVSW